MSCATTRFRRNLDGTEEEESSASIPVLRPWRWLCAWIAHLRDDEVPRLQGASTTADRIPLTICVSG